MYRLKKVFNVITRLDPEEEDVNVVSFSTRSEAKEFFDKCKEQIKTEFSNYDVCEEGNEWKGNMIVFTAKGPYIYARLQGCDLMSSTFRTHEYFTHKEEKCYE